MKGLDLSRPDVLFLLVWGGTTILAYEDLYYMGFDSSRPITLLIVLNIVSFFVIHAITTRAIGRTPAGRDKGFREVDGARLDRLNLMLFAIWSVLFLFIVYRSHGVPIWWRLRHLDKSYVDFGVPTLSGFTNMVRSFVFCLSVLMYLNRGSRRAAAVAMILMVSSLLEMARANTTYLLLCGMGVFLVSRRVRAKAFGVLVIFGVGFVLLFGTVEQYRSPGGSGGEKILQYQSVLNKLPYGVTSVYLYLTTPVSNLYYAEAHGITPLFSPYYSLQLVVPTVIRERMYPSHTYPIALRRVSHNATTFYSPFVADFGVAAAGLLVCIIQFVVSYVHVRAAQGDVFHRLVYGPLFAALVLSFFFNYFLTLGVVLFPLLAWLVIRSPGANGTRQR